eukprot:CAMPEP_0176063162 /NCGR_PEP_ID=MMETSP0120_2-20121206/31501_1 /TAXON_ID=160619 /ORGANISM="Kryptoperidinium foliaceum, Strain CCMP 1326" /LENGTH=80 /DNA_ID=CAMNT_0017396735 /DNA_START=41 /DNA_END=280 /DNA_ORIENTATION=+
MISRILPPSSRTAAAAAAARSWGACRAPAGLSMGRLAAQGARCGATISNQDNIKATLMKQLHSAKLKGWTEEEIKNLMSQ